MSPTTSMPPARATTLHDLLSRGEADRPALGAPGRASLSHGALRDLVGRTVGALRAHGVRRNDRVAIVLPNGPEMAAAFVAVASGATAAPLNPAYTADEFAFYLNDLKAKALLVEAAGSSPAVAVAEKLGIPVLTLSPEKDGGAGAFTLEGGGSGSGDYAERTTPRSSSTPPERPPGRRSCRFRSATSLSRPATSRRRWR